MLLVFFIGKEKLATKEQLDHLIDLVMGHYVQKTYVENEFKLARVATVEVHAEGKESLAKEAKLGHIAEKNMIKGPADLKKIVEEEASNVIDNGKIDIEFSEKIFMHNDDDKRVTFQHIKAFYQKSKKEKFDPKDFIFYFGHALKGKDEAVYLAPISRNLDDVKKEVYKKIDVKQLGANQRKKVKQMKKLIENQYINVFQKTHFGIVPLTLPKFKEICQ